MTPTSARRPVTDQEDPRLWWQKLADGIADGFCWLMRLIGAIWDAWNWRERRYRGSWWNDDD